jgi:hypothetical protein
MVFGVQAFLLALTCDQSLHSISIMAEQNTSNLNNSEGKHDGVTLSLNEPVVDGHSERIPRTPGPVLSTPYVSPARHSEANLRQSTHISDQNIDRGLASSAG